MGITATAAMLALIGGLAGNARATILSAGPFPGGSTSVGFARCMVTNAGNTDVLVKSVELRDPAGAVITTGLSGITISPGYTLSVASSSMDPATPASCVFDLSTGKGVRAAFVY
jgi:hypothetical protein